jgi:hypothetical protein
VSIRDSDRQSSNSKCHPRNEDANENQSEQSELKSFWQFPQICCNPAKPIPNDGAGAFKNGHPRRAKKKNTEEHQAS